jgi:hypothetical protein
MRTHLRIATIQRSARELGRLRTGFTDGKAPKRSQFWIISSPAEHIVAAAAEEWGGTVEKWQPQGNGAPQFRAITKAVAIDAILPPGDPLSQSYEVWNRGGCARRCDGQTDLLSDTPCFCRQKWGEDFHLIKAPQRATAEQTPCQATTRLSVILPSMPDIGVFRMETHSYYAANEVAASVDMIRAAVGSEALVPVSLRIEQRTRVAQGQTKHFPVVAVELRGSTAGQVLAAVMGDKQAVAGSTGTAALGGSNRQAIEATTPKRTMEDYTALALGATTMDELTAILRDAQKQGLGVPGATPDQPGDELFQFCMARREEIDGAAGQKAIEQAPADDELDTLWSQITEKAPNGWDTKRLEREFKAYAKSDAAHASAEQMRGFLAHIQQAAA